jgi:hypothetical protein
MLHLIKRLGSLVLKLFLFTNKKKSDLVKKEWSQKYLNCVNFFQLTGYWKGLRETKIFRYFFLKKAKQRQPIWTGKVQNSKTKAQRALREDCVIRTKITQNFESSNKINFKYCYIFSLRCNLNKNKYHLFAFICWEWAFLPIWSKTQWSVLIQI